MHGTIKIARIRAALARGYNVTEKGVVIGLRGRPLKPTIDKYGRPTISVRRTPTAKSRSVLVHQLAAVQWFGNDLFDADVQIRHLDENPTNNARSNLALGTASDNSMDRRPEKRVAMARNAASYLKSLSDKQVRALRRDRRRGAKYATLMAKYRLTKSTVSYIVNRITYADVSDDPT